MTRYDVRCTLTPSQPDAGTDQQGIDVTNISSCEWQVEREPTPNGELGMNAHDISYIVIVRRGDGQDDPGSALVKLAGGRDERAYFSGEILLSPPTNSTQIVRTLRWDVGHICSLKETVTTDGITQRLDVAVTKLTVDDAEFQRVVQRS